MKPGRTRREFRMGDSMHTDPVVRKYGFLWFRALTGPQSMVGGKTGCVD